MEIFSWVIILLEGYLQGDTRYKIGKSLFDWRYLNILWYISSSLKDFDLATSNRILIFKPLK